MTTNFDWLVREQVYQPPHHTIEPARAEPMSLTMRIFLILAVLAVIGGVLAFAAGIQAPQI